MYVAVESIANDMGTVPSNKNLKYSIKANPGKISARVGKWVGSGTLLVIMKHIPWESIK